MVLEMLLFEAYTCEWLRFSGLPGTHGLRDVTVCGGNSGSIIGLSMAHFHVATVFLLQFLSFSLPLVYHTVWCVFEQIGKISVLRSAFVPILAISLFRTLTSGMASSLITVVEGDVRTTVFPGANVSHKPMRSLFSLLVTFLANLSSREMSHR